MAGCGLFAGLDEQFTYQLAPRDGGARDGTVAGPDGQVAMDGGAVADAFAPPDVYYADANEPPPDAAEAGCVNPAQCDTTRKCCEPAVCNAAAKCVGKCEPKGEGCGNPAACCFGLACTENLNCETTCAVHGAPCNADTNPCCVGDVCPPQSGARCEACRTRYIPCRFDWECCNKKCVDVGGYQLCN